MVRLHGENGLKICIRFRYGSIERNGIRIIISKLSPLHTPLGKQ